VLRFRVSPSKCQSAPLACSPRGFLEIARRLLLHHLRIDRKKLEELLLRKSHTTLSISEECKNDVFFFSRDDSPEWIIGFRLLMSIDSFKKLSLLSLRGPRSRGFPISRKKTKTLQHSSAASGSVLSEKKVRYLWRSSLYKSVEAKSASR